MATHALFDRCLPAARVVRIIADTDKRELSLFLGAGASVSSGIPSAGTMIGEWREQAYREANPGAGGTQQDWLQQQAWYGSESEYSDLFEALYHNAPTRQKYLERKIEPAFPGWGYLYLASMIEKGWFNIVYTTNFDDLIADGLSIYCGYNPVVCAVDSQVEMINPTTDRAKIIKLHGDYLFRRLKNTRDELNALDPVMDEKFREFSRHRGLVVIGYAGRDRSVMDILGALLADGRGYFPTDIYWGMREGDAPSEALCELAEAYPDRLRPFVCNDFDLFMADLHQALHQRHEGGDTDFDIPQSVTLPYRTLHSKFDRLVRQATDDPAVDAHAEIRRHRERLEARLNRLWVQAEDSPDLVLLEAQLLVARRDYQGARTRADAFLAKKPGDAAGLNVLGAACAIEAEETGRSTAMDEARDHWLAAIAADPQAIMPRRSLAQYYALRSDYSEAIAQMETLLELAPNDKTMRLNLGAMYLRVHRHEDALRQADWLLDRAIDDPGVHAFRAEILAAIGRTAEAAEQAQRAVALDPDNTWTRLGYGLILFQCGQFPQSEEQLREAIRLDPNNAMAMQRLCILLAGQGRMGELQMALDQLRERSPHLANAFERMFQQSAAFLQAGQGGGMSRGGYGAPQQPYGQHPGAPPPYGQAPQGQNPFANFGGFGGQSGADAAANMRDWFKRLFDK